MRFFFLAIVAALTASMSVSATPVVLDQDSTQCLQYAESCTADSQCCNYCYLIVWSQLEVDSVVMLHTFWLVSCVRHLVTKFHVLLGNNAGEMGHGGPPRRTLAALQSITATVARLRSSAPASS
ncbi:hypothetical protein DFH29DRAFT_1070192, partial [Suillus ampliporus]